MLSRNEIIEKGRWVLDIESKAISDLAVTVDDRFADAVDLIYSCSQKVVVTGMGKSGHIARKIAATMASTGTPAFFVHPAEAQHGDLGMMSRGDLIIAISNSGNTEEVARLLPVIKRMGISLIAIVGRRDSQLGINSDITLEVKIKTEACPLGLAPTASTTATLALGDALAIALLSKRGFKEEDFALSHPAGALGRRLILTVADLMHTGDAVPVVLPSTSTKDVIMEMTSKKLGMTSVVDSRRRGSGQAGELIGIITDGDLRRFLESGADIMDSTAESLMTKGPKTIMADALAAKALSIIETAEITSLVVVDNENRVNGIVHLHDILKAGVV